TAAADLPGPLSSAVLTPARVAFGSELHTVATISAVLLAIVAIAATVLLRHVPPTGRETQPAEEATAQTVG
ncbi:MAG TPA: MFS transporter, partial [Streptosporangiaceae bacterium]|nr:MFS transporter [Streptosporangiaceae bacterium]